MEIWLKLGGMAPVCDGASSHFALEQSLVIFLQWPSALATLCNTFGQSSCILVVSQPLEALRRCHLLQQTKVSMPLHNSGSRQKTRAASLTCSVYLNHSLNHNCVILSFSLLNKKK